MTHQGNDFETLNASGQLSPQRLAEMRSAGMHAIRFQLVVRLMHAGLREDTLSIYWDHSPQSLAEMPFGEGQWRLVLGRGRGNATVLADRCVLCYPDDAEVRHSVESALDQMVARACRQDRGELQPRLGPVAVPNAMGPGAGVSPRRDPVC